MQTANRKPQTANRKPQTAKGLDLGYSVRSLEVVRRLSSPASPWRFLSAARPGRMRHDAVTVFARTKSFAVRFTSAHPTPPSLPSHAARVLAPSCSSERKSRSAPRAMQMCGSAARLLSNRKGFGVISMRIARSRAKPERLRRALLLVPLPSLISMRLLLLLLPALRSWQ
jgi:hypothetical protein